MSDGFGGTTSFSEVMNAFRSGNRGLGNLVSGFWELLKAPKANIISGRATERGEPAP